MIGLITDYLPLVISEDHEPTKTGVYACRTPDPNCPDLAIDIFLLWHEGRWSYLGSDAFYRGRVLSFVGPIPRTRP